MIAWMLYTALVGLCTVVAALAAEWLARVRKLPTRFVWIGAATLCTLLPATARLRPHAVAPAVGHSVDLASLALVQTSMQSVERHMTSAAEWCALGLWAVATLLVASVFGSAYVRLRRARGSWHEVELLGHRVLVSPAFGPIVLGFVRPRVIMPQWVLRHSTDEQRLMLDHELSHVRSRDPMVLGVACMLVALMPWNPALWIILSRIRLAVEIDCDHRVLRRGVSARAYGCLLVDVAEQTSALHFAAIALADRSSHLQHRILAMQPRRITHPIIRGVTVATVGAAALLAACEAKLPTAADIDHMDAASVERNARQLALTGDTIVWLVDGKSVSEWQAKAIPRDSIRDVTVNTLAGPTTIRVNTIRAGQIGVATTGGDQVRDGDVREPGVVDGKVNPAGALQGVIVNEQPLLLIDGVRSSLARLKSIDRTQIDRVEIVKGQAALQLYGEAAKNGAIVVTTKSTGAR